MEESIDVAAKVVKNTPNFAAHDSRLGSGRTGTSAVKVTFGVKAHRAEKSDVVREHSTKNLHSVKNVAFAKGDTRCFEETTKEVVDTTALNLLHAKIVDTLNS